MHYGSGGAFIGSSGSNKPPPYVPMFLIFVLMMVFMTVLCYAAKPDTPKDFWGAAVELGGKAMVALRKLLQS